MSKRTTRKGRKDDPGQPMRGWTIGGGTMWPRRLAKRVRLDTLARDVSMMVGDALKASAANEDPTAAGPPPTEADDPELAQDHRRAGCNR